MMKLMSLEDKKTYFAKQRQSNYMASLRLEGFATRDGAASLDHLSRQELIERYRQKRD